MSLEHMLLLMLLISGGVFFFIALALSSLGTRINLLPSTVRNPSNDVSVNSNGESGVDHQDDGLSGRLSAESSLIGRSVQAVALISGGLLGLRTVDGRGFIRVPSEEIARAMKKKALPEIIKISSNKCSGDITIHLNSSRLPIGIRRLVRAFKIF